MIFLRTVIFPLVQLFVVRQIMKWGKSLDWQRVREDLVARVEKLVPGEEWDEAAKFVTEVLVDLVAQWFQGREIPQSKIDATNLVHHALDDANEKLLKALAQRALERAK